MLEGPVRRDPRRVPPDHDRQLGLQIEGVGAGRLADWLAVADHRAGEHREEDGPGRPLPALLTDVIQVVVADPHDLAGPRYRRGEADRRPID